MSNKELEEIIDSYTESYTKILIDALKKPRKKIDNPCRQNCSLNHCETIGHGWVEWTCLMSGGDAPLGKECPYTKEEIENRYDKIKHKRIIVL